MPAPEKIELYQCPRCPEEVLKLIGSILVCQECDYQMPIAMIEVDESFPESPARGQ